MHTNTNTQEYVNKHENIYHYHLIEFYCVFRTLMSGKLYDFIREVKEAVENIINSNSADGGKYPNYIQLYTYIQKKRKREISNTSSNNKCLIVYL